MATTAQVESARNVAAFRTFVSRMGEEFGPYDCAANGEKIVQRVIQTWGQQSLSSPDSYEIAAKELIGENSLTKDDNYVSHSLRAEIEKMSHAEAAQKYRLDPAFRKAFDIVAHEEARTRFSESDPYRALTVSEYYAIPPQKRAELYARNAWFQNAVQRLIGQGDI